MMTDTALTNRIDAHLAVDRALTRAERTAFRDKVLTGSYGDAEPADWMAEAAERDAHLDIIEPWMAVHGAHATATLHARYGLPEPLIQRVLVSSIYATIALAGAELGGPHRLAVQIAGDALLWAGGFAERCGWTPGARPEPGTCPDGASTCMVDHDG